MDIFKIVRKDDIQTFCKILETHPEQIHTLDKFGDGILMKAAFWGSNEIAKFLIDSSIQIYSIGYDEYTFLDNAILNENIELIKYIIEKNTFPSDDKIFRNALLLAIDADSFENFKLIYNYCKIDTTHKWYEDIIKKTINDGRIKALIRQAVSLIEEPVSLIARDDLIDPYTLEEIVPGMKYCIRMDSKSNYYCMGTKETIDMMIETKFKTSNPDMVFDLVSNQPVSLHTIKTCVKRECPSGIRKIQDKIFTEADVKAHLTDEKYIATLLYYAKLYNNEEAINILSDIKKD